MGGIRDQPGLSAQGAGNVQWCRLVHMHVRGWGWARRPAVTSGVRGLCSADNCHALYCTCPQSLLLFRAFLPLQPGPDSHPPGQASSKEVPGGQGPGRAWASPPGAPSHPEPRPPRSGGGPCRVWLSLPPSPSWALPCPTPS